LNQAFEITPDLLHARFLEHAPKLAAQAAERAARVGRDPPAEIDAVLISTAPVLCPGLTSYLRRAAGLRPDVLALDLVGQAAGRPWPIYETARSLVAAGHCKRVLSSAWRYAAPLFIWTMTRGLSAACLFGDWRRRSVLSASANGGRRVAVEGRRLAPEAETANALRLRAKQRAASQPLDAGGAFAAAE